MYFLRNKGLQEIVCAACKERMSAKDLMFLCPAGKNCRGFKAGNSATHQKWPFDVVFTPRKYSYQVDCIHCKSKSYLKICPKCYTQQPLDTGNDETIAVIGASRSGKTCFITGLIRQIKLELSREVKYGMSLEWIDQTSYDYFSELEKTIYKDWDLPDSTQREQLLKSLQITVRFPSRRWMLPRQGKVSLVFPDPAGEFFHTLNDAYYLNYLAYAKAIILMVDPFAAESYQILKRERGEDITQAQQLMDPVKALNAFIHKVRGEAGIRNGQLKQDLAIVITKCDEPNVFDPDDHVHDFRYPVQGRKYAKRIHHDLIQRVKQEMEQELKLSDVVANSRQNFRNVGFFAASALGRPPKIVEQEGITRIKLDHPQPRRVEDPFLWILHRWGYI